MLHKMVILKHNINTLIAHVPKDRTPGRMEHLQVVYQILSPSRSFFLELQTKQVEQNSRVIFLIAELVTTVETLNVPDEMTFEYVAPLENFRLKLLSNCHKQLDTYMTFMPMVVGSRIYESKLQVGFFVGGSYCPCLRTYAYGFVDISSENRCFFISKQESLR